MIELATIAQMVAVISACWAIISGVGAWKREFIGKRQIELAEQVLEKFFEVKDAIAYIRNPFASSDEGKTRQRRDGETTAESDLLDRGYIVVERYSKKENVFADFNTLKYKFMASFGPETEQIFIDTNKALNSIFVSARMLATHYWQRQGRVQMEKDEFQKHLDEMHRHEGIFWDIGSDTDEIRIQLKAIQERLEQATASCFQEPMSTFKILTKKWL
ncbi:hypothetical protein NMQ14_08075 [Methyloversatilis sp. XJ19-13]|uniref:hypothetical protein n=1 Tax=Methyloversatilis sp. XJ19-13 TaxID=2963430 RepID=UPI00211C78BF|nr:hypothetical protein [Methyloversatilis sp. XJ19-13]MCQ9374202.1 hypothetical protein [Methyloversatilis sp. XJ19-13]